MVRYVDVAPEVIRAQNSFAFYQTLPVAKTFASGLVVPLVPRLAVDRDVPSSVKWFGGVYDEAGRYRPESVFRRRYGPVVDGRARLEQARVSVDVRDEDVLYGGVLINHFGHFLVDSLTRLWPIVAEGWKGRVVFLKEGEEPVPDYQWQILANLGLDRERVLIADRVCCFRSIRVPAPSWVTGVALHRIHGALFAGGRGRLPAPRGRNGRIYISRCRMTEFPVIGEAALEDMFRAAGFTIVHPETLPFEAQTEIFRAAGTIIGLSASAMGNLLWCEPGPDIIQLSRGRTLWPSYRMIDRICGFQPTYVNTAPADYMPDTENIGPFCIDLDRTVAFLKAEGLVPTGVTVAQRTADLMPAYRREGRLTGALLLSRQGRLADALAVLRAVANETSDPRAWRRLAEVGVRSGAWPQALEAADRWVRAAPAVAEAWLALGAARAGSGDYVGANRALILAGLVDPAKAEGWSQAFDLVVERRGSVPRARTLILRALICRIAPADVFRLVRLLVQAGRPEVAAVFLLCLGFRGLAADAWRITARELVRRGRTEQARQLIDRALFMFPALADLRALSEDLTRPRPDSDSDYSKSREIRNGS